MILTLSGTTPSVKIHKN